MTTAKADGLDLAQLKIQYLGVNSAPNAVRRARVIIHANSYRSPLGLCTKEWAVVGSKPISAADQKAGLPGQLSLEAGAITSCAFYLSAIELEVGAMDGSRSLIPIK